MREYKPKKQRQAMMLYFQWLPMIKRLNDKQAKDLIVYMIEYSKALDTGESVENNLDDMTNAIFGLIVDWIDKDYYNYVETCKTRSDVKKAYWQEKKSLKDATVYNSIQENTPVYKTLHSDTVLYKGYQIEKDKDKEIQKEEYKKEDLEKDCKEKNFKPSIELSETLENEIELYLDELKVKCVDFDESRERNIASKIFIHMSSFNDHQMKELNRYSKNQNKCIISSFIDMYPEDLALICKD